MNTMKYKTLLIPAGIFILSFFQIAYSDVSEMRMEEVEVQPREIEHARDLASEYPDDVRLELPLLSEEEEREIVSLIQDKRKLYTSISRAVSVNQSNWHPVGQRDSFNIWQLHIYSPEALGVKVWFSRFDLNDEMSVKVYGLKDNPASFVGEYVGKGPADGAGFWSPLIPDDTVVVEVWTQSAVSPDAFPFAIYHLDHHFRDAAGNIQQLNSHSFAVPQSHSDCPFGNNLCVFPDGVERWRGVARINYTPPPGQGSGAQCTAGLLNTGTGASDDHVYLLTAYHCIDAGTNPEMPIGTFVNISIAIGVSDCVPADQRISATGARFIAANARGDYALLSVDESDLQATTASTFLRLGSSSVSLSRGEIIEALHHARGTDQNYLQTEIVALDHYELNDLFSSCNNSSGCSHYTTHYRVGGSTRGSSGSPMWLRQNTQVVGVLTHGRRSNVCGNRVSRMSKIIEDGRVACALEHGDGYYPDDTAVCDDRARPAYSNSGGGSGGGGGGSGAMDLWLLLLLGLVLLVGSRTVSFLSRSKLS